jgi:hypothetical protein
MTGLMHHRLEFATISSEQSQALIATNRGDGREANCFKHVRSHRFWSQVHFSPFCSQRRP